MDTPFKSHRLFRLGLYTPVAADLIKDVLNLFNKFTFNGYREFPFDAKNGTFGKYNHDAFVIVMPDGELALEKYVYAHRPEDIITDDDAIEMLKHSLTAYLELHRAFTSNKSAWALTKANNSKENVENMNEMIKNTSILLKHFNDEPITDDEKKIIGRPANAFEQVELNSLLEELYGNLKEWSGNNKARSKIRAYMKKIQKD